MKVDLLAQLDLGKHSPGSGDLDEVVSGRESGEREARDQK